MITVENLEFEYPDADFRLGIGRLEIARDETVAITGPSGCGKTTLVNLLSGILAPTAGRIAVESVVISEFGEEDRRDFRAVKMGLVFQEFELLDYLTVLDNIILPYRVTSILELEPPVIERARAIATGVGLADKLRRSPSRLSQGERQRVAVCRALIARPGILFGDEPTGNLDPANRDHVMDLLFSYAKAERAPLVVITHDPELLPRFDRTIDIREVAR